MQTTHRYPVGTFGKPWGEPERKAWLEKTAIKREYQQEVVPKIKALGERFDIEQYGALSYDEARYPLFCLKS